MLQKDLNIDIIAHDSHVQKSFVINSIEDAANNSSLLFVLSEHDKFKDLSNYSMLMDNLVILDTNNIVEKHEEYEYYNYDNQYKIK